jgi:hypothetical protein
MFRLVLLASLGFSAPVAAECAMIGLIPRVATPSSTSLPAGGGIVVYSDPKIGTNLEPGDAAMPKSWRFKGATSRCSCRSRRGSR